MSSHKERGSQREGHQSKHPPKQVEDVISDSEEDYETEDPLASALFTRDGLPLAEALVYIATAISNLSSNLQSYSEKSLRLQKYVAKQLQAISESIAPINEEGEGEEERPDDEAASTAAQVQGEAKPEADASLSQPATDPTPAS